MAVHLRSILSQSAVIPPTTNKGPSNDFGPRVGAGCFDCGEDTHNKSDCPNPHKFTTCQISEVKGHSARACPNPRKFTANYLPDL